jgi:hypothetical protein
MFWFWVNFLTILLIGAIGIDLVMSFGCWVRRQYKIASAAR